MVGLGQTLAEIDNGGVRFLELSKGPTYWADVIHNEFIKQGNCRRKYQIEKISFDKFKESLIDLYN